MSFAPGAVIAGKYRVERVIGEGGMGVVFAARHLGLDEMVAVKLIREERAEGTDALARFQREARAAARIKSEHVARVLDVDRLPEGSPYIVMELIDGTDLEGYVKRRGSLPPEEAASYLIQACEGVAEAHALGMVHRDLKLKNLFLTKRRDGRALIKVIDFGVVKLHVSDDGDTTLRLSAAPATGLGGPSRDATLTSASTIVGSVHYMAPEQIRASNVVDARADVWSLGICLYAMLTSSLPFDGPNLAVVCAAIQGRPAPDVRELAPHVPAEMAAVVARALEKDLRRRFANLAELSAALAPFGPDRAAAGRIQTILQSGAPAPYELPPARGLSPATITHEVRPKGGRRPEGHIEHDASAKGRVESTMDAAAVGSLIPPSASTRSPRGPFVKGALISLAAAGVTLGLWTRARAPATEVEVGSAAVAVPSISSDPAPLPTPTATPITPTPSSPAATAATSQASLPASPPPVRSPGKRGAVRPPRPLPSPPPPPPPAQPKSEPSNAYDHF